MTIKIIKKSNNIINFIFNLVGSAYVFTVGFTSAFAINQWLRVYVVLAMVIIFAFSLTTILLRKDIKTILFKEDLFLLAFLFSLPLQLYWIDPSSKFYNYILAYYFVFLGLYIGIRSVFIMSLRTDRILKINTIAVIFTSCIAIFEFIQINFFGFDIDPYFFHVVDRGLNNNPLHHHFFRSRAFALEPGDLAFYLETLGPIAVFDLWSRIRSRKILFLSLVCILILGWITTFSAASFAILPLSVIIVFVIKIVKNIVIKASIQKKEIFFIFMMTIIIFLFIQLMPVIKNADVLSSIFDKVTLSQNISSSSARVEQWHSGVVAFKQSPYFGKGLGNTSSQTGGSYLSWYIDLLVEVGLIPTLLILSFLILKILKTFQSNVNGKSFMLIGLIAGLIHLSIFSVFFYPCVWTVMLITDIVYIRSKQIKYVKT